MKTLLRQRWLMFMTSIMILLIVLAACGGEPAPVEVTATPIPNNFPTPTPDLPTNTPIQPTPNPTRVAVSAPTLNPDGTYTVVAGDTLAIIASRFSVPLVELIALNGLDNADVLEIGQILQIPKNLPTPTPIVGFKTIPDSELVYGPTAANFDVAAYVKGKNGFLYNYSQELEGDIWSGVEVINRIALEHSVNPRLLLALLEYQTSWLSEARPVDTNIQYPYKIIDINVPGLYLQLRRTANWLNQGYYGWRYRGLSATSFADGTPLTFAPDLNAGTIGVQYFFARISTPAEWQFHVSEQGFFQTYLNMFGDPFPSSIELVPTALTQPTLRLPFPPNETWYFTGGPHGAFNSGSAWAAIDFAPPAPPDDLIAQQGFCYVSPNWVTAVASGVIARSGDGFVVLDLDGDGNEHTGWSIVYLHIATQGRVAAGTKVNVGDRIGHPSCEGGFSSATHLHFARRYNGEWIPITCFFCASDINVPALVMGEWTFIAYQNQEYQGYAINKAQETRAAEQGRETPINQFRYEL